MIIFMYSKKDVEDIHTLNECNAMIGQKGLFGTVKANFTKAIMELQHINLDAVTDEELELIIKSKMDFGTLNNVMQCPRPFICDKGGFYPYFVPLSELPDIYARLNKNTAEQQTEDETATEAGDGYTKLMDFQSKLARIFG